MKVKKVAFLSHLDLNLYLFRLPIMIALVERGYKVYAICPRGEKFDEFSKYGIEALEYNIKRQSLNPFKEISTIRNIYKVIKPLKLDILQNFTAKPNIYGSIAGHLSKIPLIVNAVTGLGSFYIEENKKAKVVKKIMNSLYKEANKKANYCIFQNNDDMNYFIKNKLVAKNKAILIKSSGIDTKIFKPIKEKKLENNDEKKSIKVLMIARAIWHKGIKEYYEAAKVLENENIRFIFIGDTDDGNISCASKDFLKKGNVDWLGHRYDIKEQIADCDIFVLPSYREGVPRTLLEASSMGKPIVTTNTVGCKEVVDDGINGFLVPIKDSKSLAERIKNLANNYELRENMGKASREKALNEFDVKVIVEQYLRLYNV
ncbi:N,N'-diacetylbacillosaminyl-diphospho-undecaprenol alpha-1,3-N-acetylgalactosaminyltransferase [Aliarcobacter cryaerophilus]|uniref:N, N'-diacetylbacillosaminyl-diphospho-undecaprenol alpha-1,3-N-acetylgalactosaminyltransferase n=1 Tax=Aliarcobacter cryaerophilus TaxID=28198 RepID=UPI003DA39F4C